MAAFAKGLDNAVARGEDDLVLDGLLFSTVLAVGLDNHHISR